MLTFILSLLTIVVFGQTTLFSYKKEIGDFKDGVHETIYEPNAFIFYEDGVSIDREYLSFRNFHKTTDKSYSGVLEGELGYYNIFLTIMEEVIVVTISGAESKFIRYYIYTN